VNCNVCRRNCTCTWYYPCNELPCCRNPKPELEKKKKKKKKRKTQKEHKQQE
jgi:hypothetical protein